jgi:hypothetical protein
MNSLFLFFSLAFAGDRLPAGTILSEESYVFSIEEANRIRLEIETLEASLRNKEEIIKEYEELDRNQAEKFQLLNDKFILKEEQIKEYKSWLTIEQARTAQLEKKTKFWKFERWGFLLLGVGITTGSILIADQVDDFIDKN